MKYIPMLLAALGLATATPAAAQTLTIQYGQSYGQNYRPYSHDYRYGYRGPLFMDRYGYYRCINRFGRAGYLLDRYWRPVTRYNMHYTYYGPHPRHLRCR
jgi:hypothetical protein